MGHRGGESEWEVNVGIESEFDPILSDPIRGS